MSPDGREVCFTMSVVDELELAHDRVGRIRSAYPASPIVLLLDGPVQDPATWPSGAGIEARPTGGGLYALEGRGRVVEAHLEAFRALPRSVGWWFKVDPDTIVRRRVADLPRETCFFGALQGGSPGPSLQGGCVGGTRAAAERLLRSGILRSADLLDPERTWGRGNENVLARARRGLTSFDFVHAHACRLLGIPLRSHPEIRSEWKELPARPRRFAITHPHKELDEQAERRASLERRLVARRLRALVEEVVPAGASVAVVSKGDDRLVAFSGRSGRHFPAAPDGRWIGYHPADSAQAIAFLEEERARGIDHLVVPETASWWLDHYDGLAGHLDRTGTPVAAVTGAGAVWQLEGRS